VGILAVVFGLGIWLGREPVTPLELPIGPKPATTRESDADAPVVEPLPPEAVPKEPPTDSAAPLRAEPSSPRDRKTAEPPKRPDAVETKAENPPRPPPAGAEPAPPPPSMPESSPDTADADSPAPAIADRSDSPPESAPNHPAPRISRIEPSSIRRGRSVSVLVSGSGFPVEMVATLARGGEASPLVTVKRIRRIDETRLELALDVAPDAPLGQYTLVLATPDGARTNRVFLEVDL
jgi:hypothetical protein